jgi:hypothetical protein
MIIVRVRKSELPVNSKSAGFRVIFLGYQVWWSRIGFHSILDAKADVCAILQSGMVLQCQAGVSRPV